MPISTSSMDNNPSDEYSREEMFESEVIHFPDLSPAQAETLLKKLGGGVSAKHERVEGIGWRAQIVPAAAGVTIEFDAHDELLDDLIRRFNEWVARQ